MRKTLGRVGFSPNEKGVGGQKGDFKKWGLLLFLLLAIVEGPSSEVRERHSRLLAFIVMPEGYLQLLMVT